MLFNSIVVTRFFVFFFCVFFFQFLDAQSSMSVDGFVFDKKSHEKSVLAHYILGYKNFKFYASEEEVRKQIVEDGFAKEEEIQEKVAEIYTYPDYNSSFTIFNPISHKFIDFSFSSVPMKNLLRALRVSKDSRILGRIGHLTASNAIDFKVLSWPASKNPDWEIKLYFYRRVLNDKKVYRLFSISLDLNVGEKSGDVRVAEHSYIRHALSSILDKYGAVNYRIVKNINPALKRHYYAYQRVLKDQSSMNRVQDDKKFDYDPNGQLVTQLVVSYFQKGSKYGNFKVTYVATGLISNVMRQFTTSTVEYDDFSIMDF